MILVPGRFCYVLNPRTASRATEQAFLALGADDIGRHHGYTPYDLPVYATIRKPCDQVLSHYWQVRDRWTLEEYIQQRTPRLNIHHEVVDRYFIYEQGLDRIFTELGYPDVTFKRIGGSHADPTFLTPERIDLINRTFAEDNDLYLKALECEHVARTDRGQAPTA